MLTEELNNKWERMLNHPDLPEIKRASVRNAVALMMENTYNTIHEQDALGRKAGLLTEQPIPANAMGASSSDPTTGAVDTFDPIMISLVRRAAPNLMAFDVAGVQPMTGPTGLIFAMRSRYTNQTGNETFYNEVNTAFSTVVTGANTLGQKHTGTVPGVSNNAANGSYNFGTGVSTAQLEALGTDSNSAFPEMAFSIEKVTVTAKGRALAAGYTLEIAQDLKAIHGLDAETELSNILSTEILAEINRELIRTILVTAVPGAQTGVTTAGFFDLDTDSNGRWSVEKFKGLMFQLEREANQVAKGTRRGKGNIIICSSDVASALMMTGKLDYTPALANNLEVDDTGNTFAGVLNGRFKVYIDPYTTGDYLVVGYKGASSWDAGLFYCPYVPLQMVRAVDPQSFQPRIGFKTRYGMVANPFAQGLTVGNGAITADSNVYYRRVIVNNLM